MFKRIARYAGILKPLIRFIYLLCPLVLGLGFLNGCATGPSKKEQGQLHMNLGTSMLAKGNYRASLVELREAAKLDPSSPSIQNNLGLNYYLLEQPILAEKHLRKAVELDANYSDAHNNLSRVLIDLGQFDEAQLHAKKVIDDLTYPQPEKAWLNLGLSYFSQRKFDRATASLEKASRLDPKNCLAFTLLGRTQFELGKFHEAARILDSGSKYCKQQGFDESLYYSGLAYFKAGDRDRAIARLDELVKNFPDGRYKKQAESMRKLME